MNQQKLIQYAKVGALGAVVLFIVNMVMSYAAKAIKVGNFQTSTKPKAIALRIVHGLLIVIGISKAASLTKVNTNVGV